jgi:hypothetical protein
MLSAILLITSLLAQLPLNKLRMAPCWTNAKYYTKADDVHGIKHIAKT